MEPPSGRKGNRYSSRPKYRYRKHKYTASAGRKLNPKLREQGAKTTVDAVVSSFKINRFKWIYAVWGCRRAEKLFAQT